jgi:hypothetical protein
LIPEVNPTLNPSLNPKHTSIEPTVADSNQTLPEGFDLDLLPHLSKIPSFEFPLLETLNKLNMSAVFSLLYGKWGL